MLRYILKLIGRHVALILALGVLWLALSGEEHWSNSTLALFGLASVFLVVWLADRAGMMDREGVATQIFPGILGYWIWLFFEIGKANFTVLLLVFNPKLSPKMVEVPAPQKSDLGKAIFANSITLTPGTVSVDLHDGSILVHGLTEELADVEGMTQMGEKVAAFDGADEKEEVSS